MVAGVTAMHDAAEQLSDQTCKSPWEFKQVAALEHARAARLQAASTLERRSRLRQVLSYHCEAYIAQLEAAWPCLKLA